MTVSGPAPFTLTVSHDEGRLVLAAGGELDLATAPELEAAVLPPTREGRDVLLDLRGLAFMDSSGVRVVIAAHHAAAEHGGRFRLLRTEQGSAVQRVLEISGLETILDIVDDDDR
jgi:anti-anti-sigma factor